MHFPATFRAIIVLPHAHGQDAHATDLRAVGILPTGIFFSFVFAVLSVDSVVKYRGYLHAVELIGCLICDCRKHLSAIANQKL
jgi:hypothetical protein